MAMKNMKNSDTSSRILLSSELTLFPCGTPPYPCGSDREGLYELKVGEQAIVDTAPRAAGTLHMT